MRSSTLLSAAALAGCAFSSPLVKRDDSVEVETVYDTVNTVAYVTVTATATAPVVYATETAPAEAPAPAAPAPVESAPAAEEETPVPAINFKENWKWGEHKFTWAWTSSYEQPAPAPTTEAAAPAPTTEAPAPAPEPTTSEAPVAEPTSEVPAAPTSSSVAPAAPTQKSSVAESAATGKATTYQQKVLVHHNVHRANHSAPDLKWSDSLAATAEKIGKSCKYEHDVTTDGGGYGQNIAAGVKAEDISTVITDLFYNGEVGFYDGLYGQKSPDMSNFHAWGHFSQIVWVGTTEVGCATVDCSAQGLANAGSYVTPVFTVCNYKSPGNYGGEYATNVLKSLGRASVDAKYGL